MLTPFLQAFDAIEVIAPSSKPEASRLKMVQDLFNSYQIKVIASNQLYGDDLLCANSDTERFTQLKNALLNPDTKAIVALAGGYGCTRLIPALCALPKPAQAKLLIGMSDITPLHTVLNQHWGWPSIHAAAIPGRFCAASIDRLMQLLTADVKTFSYTHLKPLNALARDMQTVTGVVGGGNLCLLQSTIGTNAEFNPTQKIIVLEEINERAYRIDRMLEQLKQAHLFKDASAILLGDFLGGEEADGAPLIPKVLARFAAAMDIPVLSVPHIGHGKTNFPLLFGMKAQLNASSLSWSW